jgi:hypothetical protein
MLADRRAVVYNMRIMRTVVLRDTTLVFIRAEEAYVYGWQGVPPHVFTNFQKKGLITCLLLAKYYSSGTVKI